MSTPKSNKPAAAPTPLLPSTAPVSSLLPPIPAATTQQHQHHNHHHHSAVSLALLLQQQQQQQQQQQSNGAPVVAPTIRAAPPASTFHHHNQHHHHHVTNNSSNHNNNTTNNNTNNNNINAIAAAQLIQAAAKAAAAAQQHQQQQQQQQQQRVPVPVAAHHHHQHHQHRVAVVPTTSSSGSSNNNTASMVVATAAKPPPPTTTSPPQQVVAPAMPGMQHWSLGQLNNHISVLRQLNQPVPHSLTLLLAEATRKEERRKAKRLANRKSASTSRARKKAVVQQMTELNTRLKRQALILALLPDLVIVIDTEGVITFCSDQAERVLKYKPKAILGSKLTDLIVPSSRGKLVKLVQRQLATSAAGESSKEEVSEPVDESNGTTSSDGDGKVAKRPRKDGGGGGAQQKEATAGGGDDGAKEKALGTDSGGDNAAPAAGEGAASAAVVSDPSFPMSVVKVDAAVENNQSDTSASRDSKQPSSLTNSASLTRSPTAESLGNSGSNSDDTAQKVSTKKKVAKAGNGKLPSSDTSSSSVDAAEVKKLSKANANLERNVRYHNTNLKKRSHGPAGFKDDVTGAAVTANNASARLSSLRVSSGAAGAELPSSEDDSGYRESNDSREETSSSSASDTSELNGRRKPLAPTCNVCLIREDLTTVWCEVTSSIRTRDPEEQPNLTGDTEKSKESASSTQGDPPPPPPAEDRVKELLLCLRPIRDGEEKVDKKHRLASKRQVSDYSNTTSSGDDKKSDQLSSSATVGRTSHTPPLKKRKKEPANGSAPKRSRVQSKSSSAPAGTEDTAVAESLMMMSSNK